MSLIRTHIGTIFQEDKFLKIEELNLLLTRNVKRIGSTTPIQMSLNLILFLTKHTPSQLEPLHWKCIIGGPHMTIVELVF